MKKQTVAKRPTVSKLKRKCDILFSKYIRERDGKCLICRKTENLQCAHLLPRANLIGRWNPQNAIALCIADHIYGIAHKDPIAFAEWLKEHQPEKYKWVQEHRGQVLQMKLKDYEALHERMKQGIYE